ncbi:hypothetical protein ACJ72_03984 [Emergomyces africanus]|uniref:ORP1 n=1 Tax=Emergomyces africanus TaxID=1955775 RepID=A0A1B7NY21_9EURO|nr:hypothetical protein ACJ72_03984 [Emergomyces africanus]
MVPASSSRPLQEQTSCQFSGESCSTASNHYRKVISHIFGRNKKCTVGIPEYVWIHYCRKHYQRARYRTAEWPFRQCDLAVDTIQNMRSWGGVESFNLQLRRRETWRTARRDDNNTCGENDIGNQDEAMLEVKKQDQKSRRPFPNTGFGFFTPINKVDKVEHTNPAAKAEASGSGYEADEEGDGNKTPVCTAPPEKGIKRKRATIEKRSPSIIPRPVPDWLHTRVGSNKSFDEILSVLCDLRTHLMQLVREEQTPHFPDIEILPNLRPSTAASRCTNPRTKCRITRPTLPPPLTMIDVPALNNGLGPLISPSAQILTRRRAASYTPFTFLQAHQPKLPHVKLTHEPTLALVQIAALVNKAPDLAQPPRRRLVQVMKLAGMTRATYLSILLVAEQLV